MYYWKMFARIGIIRIDSFHATIESKNKIIKIQTQTNAVSCGELLKEIIELEFSSRLIGIIARCPYISAIGKYCSV